MKRYRIVEFTLRSPEFKRQWRAVATLRDGTEREGQDLEAAHALTVEILGEMGIDLRDVTIKLQRKFNTLAFFCRPDPTRIRAEMGVARPPPDRSPKFRTPPPTPIMGAQNGTSRRGGRVRGAPEGPRGVRKMKKLLVSVLALCAVAAGCGSPDVRVGAAGPTSAAKTITVTADPSVPDGGGLNAMVGSTAILATTGLSSWTKWGSGDTAWQPFPEQTTEYDLVVDLTTTGDKGVIIPARAGEVFVPTRWSQLVLTLTGTASGTAPAVSFGVSSAFTNVAAAAAAQTVGQINVGAGQANNVTVAGSNVALVSNSDVHAAVGTAVTGATVLTVRVALFGYWQVVPF